MEIAFYIYLGLFALMMVVYGISKRGTSAKLKWLEEQHRKRTGGLQ